MFYYLTDTVPACYSTSLFMSYKKLIIITYPHFYPIHIIYEVLLHLLQKLHYKQRFLQDSYWSRLPSLAVVWFDSYPSFPVWRQRSRIIRPRESLVLFKSFNTVFSFYSMHKCMYIIHTVYVKSVTSIYVRTYIYHAYIQERVKNVLIFYYILWFF